MTTLPLTVAPIGRLLLFAGKVPTEAAMCAAVERMRAGLPAAQDARIDALSQRFRGAVDAFPLSGPRPDPRLAVGVEEQAVLRRATAGIAVTGVSDATFDGWVPLLAVSRALAAAFDAVEMDLLTGAVRSIDERFQPVEPVRLSDVHRTATWEDGGPTWGATTFGLANLGLPEIWFDGLPPGELVPARTALLALGEGLVAQAAAALRAGKRTLKVGPIDVPELGPVTLRKCPAAHGEPALRANVRRQPHTPLGRHLVSATA